MRILEDLFFEGEEGGGGGLQVCEACLQSDILPLWFSFGVHQWREKIHDQCAQRCRWTDLLKMKAKTLIWGGWSLENLQAINSWKGDCKCQECGGLGE